MSHISDEQLSRDPQEDVLCELFVRLHPVLIADGKLVEPTPKDELLAIVLWFKDNYVYDDVAEMFDAYNRTVVLVLIDAGIITPPNTH